MLSRPLTSDGLRVARAAKNGQLLMLRNDIAAYRFISPSGRPYILMLYLKPTLRKFGTTLLGEGLPYTITLIVLVTLLCFALAYHIASPIYSIQSTARKVAKESPIGSRIGRIASIEPMRLEIWNSRHLVTIAN